MTGESAFRKVVLAVALSFSFLYYVTFIQIPLFAQAFSKNMSVLPLAAFGLLGALGCLTAGQWVDRKKPEAGQMAGVIAVCCLIEGAYGLSWPLMKSSFPFLGFVLGLHIICLFVLLGKTLESKDRVIVAGVSTAAIYLLANIVMLVGGDDAVILGRIAGAPLVFSALLLLVAMQKKTIVFINRELQEPPVTRMSNAVGLLAGVLLLVALDSFTFYGFLQGEGLPSYFGVGDIFWVVNCLHHVIAVLPAVWIFFRFGRRACLAAGAVSWLVFLLLDVTRIVSPLGVPLFFYSLFVSCYSVVFFTLWPSVWMRGREGLPTALGMMVCGFGGSVGGIGLRLLLQF